MDEIDSRVETLKHISEVRRMIGLIVSNLTDRGIEHDATKLESPEKEILDRVTPNLKNIDYGSDEYHECMKEMKPMLDHHYKNNSHHPEHWENGIEGMTLVDLVELFCDNAAATYRHDTGNIFKSIEHNKDRFGYGKVLTKILENTARELQMGKGSEKK